MSIEWKIYEQPVAYPDALDFMDKRVAAIHEGRADDCVWLLEHPAIYTAGTSARDEDLLRDDLPVFKTGRGGQYTYHGPGQRVAYVMLDLKARQQAPDIKKYVWCLEEWVIKTLARFEILGERRCGRIGIWVDTPAGEKKIAAIGVRVRHWVTLHGVSINLDPDLSAFEGIIPCGIKEHGVTSMAQLLKQNVSYRNLDAVLREEFDGVLNPQPD